MSIVFNGHTVAGAPPPSDTANAAKKADLTSIIATGATNATGATITSGTYFYLNGTLVIAKADIASGATFTENTNYEAVTAGGLNSLKSAIIIDDNVSVTFDSTGRGTFTTPTGYIPVMAVFDQNWFCSVHFNQDDNNTPFITGHLQTDWTTNIKNYTGRFLFVFIRQ